ncbi:hypothetical protein MUP77_02635 [Candidatus Bathyarchaeota archaeon]|jgi:riboflavin transporter FmnP|nr:hypothetical protein [Candidatus Bathyarchaeota archaeon]
MKWNTTTLAGTATLSALVVILDYALKYSNLKIPFPLLPYLKFDFTGIPVVISALLFGLFPGILTSAVARATTSRKHAAECQRRAEKYLARTRIGNVQLLS